MGRVPERCPVCGEREHWKLVDTSNKGFSVGKAAVGAVLFGPVGLVGGALGKRDSVITAESVVLTMNIKRIGVFALSIIVLAMGLCGCGKSQPTAISPEFTGNTETEDIMSGGQDSQEEQPAVTQLSSQETVNYLSELYTYCLSFYDDLSVFADDLDVFIEEWNSPDCDEVEISIAVNALQYEWKNKAIEFQAKIDDMEQYQFDDNYSTEWEMLCSCLVEIHSLAEGLSDWDTDDDGAIAGSEIRALLSEFVEGADDMLNRYLTPVQSVFEEASTSATVSTTENQFTNEYGTPTTKCAHDGCTNYIASSGDTNCCTEHSNRCLECNKYIDEDAFYCVSCIEKVVEQVKSEKHTCEECGKEGNYTITGITGQTEYYCYTHYKEIQEMYNLLFGDN